MKHLQECINQTNWEPEDKWGNEMGHPLFVGKDVADILGFSDSNTGLRSVR